MSSLRELLRRLPRSTAAIQSFLYGCGDELNMVAGRLIRPPHFPPTRATAARVTSRAGTLGATRAPIGGGVHPEAPIGNHHLATSTCGRVRMVPRVVCPACTSVHAYMYLRTACVVGGPRSRVRSSWPRTQGEHHILGVYKRGERTEEKPGRRVT